MANRETAFIEITPEVLLKAYACGIFPMAESADDPALYWIEPEKRGVIPLDRFHMPSRLARTVRSDRFTITVDRDFDAVLEGCAEPRAGRPRTWINTRIRVLRREHVPPRARCVQSGAGAPRRPPQGRRIQAARHAVRDRSPADLRRDRGAAAPISQAARSGAYGRGRLRRARHEASDQGRAGAGAAGEGSILAPVKDQSFVVPAEPRQRREPESMTHWQRLWIPGSRAFARAPQ